MTRTFIFATGLAVAAIVMFALASVNHTFVGDRTILEALRAESESWQEGFGFFDISAIASLAVVLSVAGAFFVRRKLCEGVCVLVILPVQALVISLPKFLIARPRPEGPLEGSTNSFPSGTAATSVLILGFLIYIIGIYVVQPRLRLALQALLGTSILALGFFRVAASEHWPSDVLAGFLVGGLALIGVILLYRRLLLKRERQQALAVA